MKEGTIGLDLSPLVSERYQSEGGESGEDEVNEDKFDSESINSKEEKDNEKLNASEKPT